MNQNTDELYKEFLKEANSFINELDEIISKENRKVGFKTSTHKKQIQNSTRLKADAELLKTYTDELVRLHPRNIHSLICEFIKRKWFNEILGQEEITFWTGFMKIILQYSKELSKEDFSDSKKVEEFISKKMHSSKNK